MIADPKAGDRFLLWFLDAPWWKKLVFRNCFYRWDTRERKIAIMLEISDQKLTLLNAGGGDAGEMTHRDLLQQFGTGVVYITNRRPM